MGSTPTKDLVKLRLVLEDAGVANTDIQQLEEALTAYQSAKVRSEHKTPQVVCTGVYNTGKSTLLNTLLGEDERFPTGDIPTTKVLARAEADGVVYIDTPGLNAAEEDDQETQSAYESADFILFVSNAQSGGVGEAEARWLQHLEKRYTADSLKKRLIYVLTHCGQVEPEQLPDIERKFRSDLEKAIGFVPEQIFCVDSITYWEGKLKNVPLLVEDSGIPLLQKMLAERLANASELLEQAWKTELQTRQDDLLEHLGKIKAAVQNRQDTVMKKQQEQSAELDAIWAQFTEELKKVMPPRGVYFSKVFINLGSSSSGRVSSLSECERKVKSALRSKYDSLDSLVNRELKAARKTAEWYCDVGIDGAYFYYCNKIGQAFDTCALSLQKIGVQISDLPELSIVPDLPSDFKSRVIGYFQENFLKESMLSFNDYVNMYVWTDGLSSKPSEYTDYRSRKGLFGREVIDEVTLYNYDTYAVKRRIEECAETAANSMLDRVTYYIDLYWNDYCNEVETETAKRKNEFKKQVDAYRASLIQASGTESISAALEYLDQIEQKTRA